MKRLIAAFRVWKAQRHIRVSEERRVADRRAAERRTLDRRCKELTGEELKSRLGEVCQ